MSVLYWAALFTVICAPGAVALAGLRRLCDAPWLVLTGAGVLAVTLLFTLEHAVGLGNLRALGGLVFLGTLAAAGYGVRLGWFDRGWLLICLPFLVAVAVGLAWRGGYPSLFPSAERLTDLYFINNFVDGARLPPVDHWLPPYAFDFYYAWQHYAAALMVRLFGVSAGGAYNIGFVLLMALTPALGWELARRQGLARRHAGLLLAVLLVGGTGASLWTPLMAVNTDTQPNNVNVYDRMAGSARFIGNFDQRANTAVGRVLAGPEPTPERQELPLETFGYLYYIGDYHPPIAGFLLLALGLAAMWAAQVAKTPSGQLAWAAGAALTVPMTLVVHAWVFPLQGLMVGLWGATQAGLAWRAGQRERAGRWIMVMALAGLAGLVLLLPFLTGFTARSLNMPVALVAADQRTPLLLWLLQMAPILVLLGLVAWAPRAARAYVVPLAVALGVMLVAAEVIYMDDLSGGRHERTNTAMKWWGWIWVAALLGVAPAVLRSTQRWVRITATVALASTLVYAVDITRFWADTGRHHAGQLHGDAIYRSEAGGAAIIDALRAAPRGVVLERVAKHAYDDAPAYSLFAGQPVWLGWALHEVTWRGQLPEIWSRYEATQAIYKGEHPDPLPLLRLHDIDHVVWSVREAQTLPDAREVLHAQLAPEFQWRELGRWGDRPVGLWTRR